MKKVNNCYVWVPKKKKIVLSIDDLVISFFAGFTVCLYLMK